LESPGLGGWGDYGVDWECWVVGVGGGAGERAGLDTELGSVLQESLGGTAAEWGSWFSLQALCPWGWGGVGGDLWVVAEGTSATVSWECGDGVIGLLDFGDLVGFCGGGFLSFLTGVLCELESSSLALLSGTIESLYGEINLSLKTGLLGYEGVVDRSNWSKVIGGPC
jgi:hypothetical protein